MSVAAAIPMGASATKTTTVTREVTVAHFHPHMPEVYGTPMMIYLMEFASARAIAPFLPPGWVSVGTEVNVKHLAATPVGVEARAVATFLGLEGKLYRFRVEAFDPGGLIGEGEHTRAIVGIERLIQGASRRAGG